MSSHPERQPQAEGRSVSRSVVSAVAVCVAGLIALEPLVIGATPGLQIFQSVFMLWFWGIFMFGGPSDSRDSQK